MGSVMLYVLMVVFFLGVLFSYLAGVRRAASWGRPLLVLCVILLVASVLYKVVGPRPGTRTVQAQ